MEFWQRLAQQFIRWISVFEGDDSQSKWRRFLGVGIVVGAIAILLRWGVSDLAAVSAALVLAGASLFSGVLVGFLFGIPKTLQRKTEPSASAPSDTDYQPNTNLEEISDWLTKMLVGVGLVELGQVPRAIDSIAAYWERCFGTACPRPFAAGVIVYFAVIGFLLGYLWTRLALVGDFIERDPRRLIPALLRKVAEEARRDPAVTERTPDREVMTQQQLEAAQALQAIGASVRVRIDDMRQQLRALAAQYESIRATMSSGPERTRRMEVVASQMRAFSLAAYSLLPEFTHSEMAGERLAAITFLQARPNREYFEWLGERLVEEKPFVGYHAAVALLNAARDATAGDRKVLEIVINQALEATTRIPESTDRRTTLRAALEALNKRSSE
jgi:predicted phage tail protein